jgi:hypothetical protein
MAHTTLVEWSILSGYNAKKTNHNRLQEKVCQCEKEADSDFK